MNYKILGNTGLKVSTLCLGTMNYGGKGFFGYMGNLDQKEVDQQIKTVIDAGVNFIDTANIYSEGHSEMMIGQAIKNLSIKRDDLVLATKVRGSKGCRMGNCADVDGSKSWPDGLEPVKRWVDDRKIQKGRY